MAHFVSATDTEKLEDLKKARQCAEHLSQYRTKYSVVPNIDPEELLELYVAIERLEGGPTVYGFKTPEEIKPATAKRYRKIYQPRDVETGKPIGPEQVFEADTEKELLLQLRSAYEKAVRANSAQATDLDTVAERILAAFKSEDETLTDATLLAASGVDREAYLDARDFLLIETEEISETADDTAPTEYVRNFPRTTQAAA